MRALVRTLKGIGLTLAVFVVCTLLAGNMLGMEDEESGLFAIAATTIIVFLYRKHTK